MKFVGSIDSRVLRLTVPSLRALSLEFRYNYLSDPEDGAYVAQVQATLSDVVSSAPLLESMAITACSSICLMPIIVLDRLRYLDLKYYVLEDVLVLQALSIMKHLTTLRLALALPHDAELSFRGFPALRQLEVQGLLHDVVLLTATLHSSPLESVVLRGYSGDRSTQNVWQCCENLRSCCASTMRSLEMSFRPLIYSEPNPLIGSSFGPLLEIRHLHDIVLNFHSWRYHCPSSDICAMAESWPELRTLAVRSTFSGIPPSVTATAEFARLCPDLQRLEFTSLSYPDSIPLDEYPQSCHGLEKFVVDDLSPQQVFEDDGPLRKHVDEQGEGLVDLARFLGRVFPRIDAARLCNKTELLSVDYINRMDRFYAQLLRSLADHDD